MGALLHMMREVGVAASQDVPTFKALVQRSGGAAVVTEQAVAEALLCMAQTQPSNGPQPAAEALAQAISQPHIVSGTDSNIGWGWRVVLDTIKSLNPGLAWPRVAELLDQPGSPISGAEGFLVLLYAYRHGAGSQLAIKALVGQTWGNAALQLSILRFAVLAPPEVLSFIGTEHRLLPVEGLMGGRLPTGTPNQAWLSIDLLQVLCYHVVDNTNLPTLREMVEYPLKHCPEVLLLTMAAVPPMEFTLLQREVFSILLPVYLTNNQINTPLVLHRLWVVNRSLVLEMLVEYFLQEHSNLPRILDICQELRMLNSVLDSTPYGFSLELAATAATCNYLSLEGWAAEHMKRDSMQFITALMTFLDARTAPDALPAKPRLSEESVRAYVMVLLGQRAELAGELKVTLAHVLAQVAALYPALEHLAKASAAFSPEVEEQANAYFREIYDETNVKPIEEVVAYMQNLKSSGNPRDLEVFRCIIHNVFDEYQYYERYPDKALASTAQLYGMLIIQQLVPGTLLSTALHNLLEALRKPPGTKLFSFGTQALNLLVQLAPTWPPFCQQVLKITHLREVEADLYTRLDTAIQMHDRDWVMESSSESDQSTSQYLAPPQPQPLDAPAVSVVPEAPAAPGAPGAAPPGPAVEQVEAAEPPAPSVAAPTVEGVGPSGAAAGVGGEGAAGAVVNKTLSMNKSMDGASIVDELEASLLAPAQQNPPKAPTLLPNPNVQALETAQLAEPAVKPSEVVADRVAFCINNLSEDNLEKMSAEIRGKVFPTYLSWFCNYMVVKRAAQEANFHKLYIKLVDKINDKEFYKALVKITHHYVRVLLNSERIVKDSNDRALLKNLGCWLGLLTFAKNKPLLSKELDLKQVIIDAYKRGRLVAVLPFVNKLLDCCESSKVFSAANPMITGILSLLAELHRMPKLKLNNVFSIEMAFKAFGNVQVDPATILYQLPREMVNNNDWGSLDEGGMDKSLLAETTSTQQAMHTRAAAAQAFSRPAPLSKPALVPASPGAAAQQGPGGAMQHGTAPAGMPAPGQAAQQQPAAGAPRMVAGPGGVMVAADAGAAAGAGVKALGAEGGAGPAGGGALVPAPGLVQPPTPLGLALEHAALIAHIAQHATINQSLGMITERLGLKRHLPMAVERAVWEIINPVVERSVTIACYTTAELLAKDFALDPDEGRMRSAAHLMVCSLAGSLALVTCKDPLRIALSQQLIALVQGGATGMDKPMLDQVVQVVVQDNLESCCQVFERAATEKAVRDVDKLLQPSYEERGKARQLGKPFADSSAFHGRFPRELPEALRPRQGAVTAMQLRVYEDFARIPRTAPPLAPASGPGGRPYSIGGEDGKEGMATLLPGMGGAVGAQYLEPFLLWQGQADAAIAKSEPGGDAEELSRCMGKLLEVAGPGAHDDVVVFFLSHMLRHFLGVAGGQSTLAPQFYITALRHLLEVLAGRGSPITLTMLWANLDDDRKFQPHAVESLLRASLLLPAELDTAMARALSTGPGPRAAAAAELLTHLCKALILRDHLLGYENFASSLDTLHKLATAAQAGGGGPAVDVQLALVEQVKRIGQVALVAARPGAEIAVAVRSDKLDPPLMREQVHQLFEQWLRLVTGQPGAASFAVNPSAHGVSDAERAGVLGCLNALKNTGMFKDEVLLERMLRCFIDMAVVHAQSQAEAAVVNARVIDSPELYLAVDGFARLLVAVTVHGAGEAFLGRALGVLVGCVKRDADERGPAFNGRPHMRLMVGVMAELPGGNASTSSGAEALDPQGLRYLRTIAVALHALQPLSVPGWAFCWLEVVAHRSFMPRLLLSPAAQGWSLYEALLVALLRFLEPYLRNSDLNDSIRALYKGTLRLLLVLLHDFPEFLCEHHFPLCDVIPTTCVQLRNLVLSAFPRSMRLPDPFTSGLKVDLLPEIKEIPRCQAAEPGQGALGELRHAALREALDAYISGRQPASFPADILHALKLSPVEAKAAGTAYNVPLLNAIVMAVGAAVRTITSPSHPHGMDIFKSLAHDLDSEGRYLALNAAANQLRYPNAHTQYFSCVLLMLFAETQHDTVKEQITRVLLERLVVNRPHPWGLLITFIELIKNPRYAFWNHNFTRNTPDVERLFKSVAASCMSSGAQTALPPNSVNGAPGNPGAAKDGEDKA